MHACIKFEFHNVIITSCYEILHSCIVSIIVIFVFSSVLYERKRFQLNRDLKNLIQKPGGYIFKLSNSMEHSKFESLYEKTI